MQLRAVDERVHQVPALPPGLHAGRFPLGAVGEHGGVVLARGDALGGGPTGDQGEVDGAPRERGTHEVKENREETKKPKETW